MDVLDRVKADGRPPGVPPRPFQFTLRTMFIVTTVAAVLCSLLIACPPLVRLVSLYMFLLVYTVGFVTVGIYGRGYVRTFAIGGALALSSLTLAGSSTTTGFSTITMSIYLATSGLPRPGAGNFWDVSGLGPAIIVGVAILSSAIAGLTAVVARWIVEQKQKAAERDHRPPPSPAAPKPVVGHSLPPEGSHAND